MGDALRTEDAIAPPPDPSYKGREWLAATRFSFILTILFF
jgi:hypothetical protein